MKSRKSQRSINIIAFGAQGDGVSGGDRIFIEIARRIQSKASVSLWLTKEGLRMCERMSLDLDGIDLHVFDISRARVFGQIGYYLSTVLLGIYVGLFKSPRGGSPIVYSASEFWMDVFPALIWKIKNKSVWVASWYQTAPNPFKGFSLEGGSRYRLASLPYWFFQKTTKPLVSIYSDFVNVNNKGEVQEFKQHDKRNRVFVMYGAVDVKKALEFQKSRKSKKGFEAVFQGRFHPQKGVVEMIEIWKLVVGKMPNAKLAMVGDGPLMQEVKQKISSLKLKKNIVLMGYLFDGDDKLELFNNSKIVVHPAYFDSGGMASAEAMVFGKPAVGFDLPSYKDYYPSGMVKVSIGDKNAFADACLNLLESKKTYEKYSKEAVEMIKQNWSWDTRVDDFAKFIL